MSIKDKFDAAVNVIRSLPKNGSYQPSNELMLQFYGFFKQATLGPCKQPKPSFWDLINKAKWDAWKKLGNMSSEEAMQAYVMELQKIVETMSYTDNVANFLDSVHELDNVSLDDLELVAPEAMHRVRSNPNSPLASRETSPHRAPSNVYIPLDTTKANILNGHHLVLNTTSSSPGTPEYSDEEYIDTVETLYANKSSLNRGRASSIDSIPSAHSSRSREKRHQTSKVGAPSEVPLSQTVSELNVEIVKAESRYAVNVCETLNYTVKCLQSDLEKANTTVKRLEASLISTKAQYEKNPLWWPFKGITPQWFIFLIVWPFIAQRISNYFRLKRKRY